MEPSYIKPNLKRLLQTGIIALLTTPIRMIMIDGFWAKSLGAHNRHMQRNRKTRTNNF